MIPVSVMKGLTAWEWPGNIRELENFIERTVILTRGKSLEAPLGELRKRDNEEPTRAAGEPDDIARIVKKDQCSKRQERSQVDTFVLMKSHGEWLIAAHNMQETKP